MSVKMTERMNMKTDNELRRDVEMELQWDPSVDARDIGVAGKNGVVTLTGQVSKYSEKWRAERIAKRVAGVVGLANDIEVSGRRCCQRMRMARALRLEES
jgi:osmotically-inducible protein OsmY